MQDQRRQRESVRSWVGDLGTQRIRTRSEGTWRAPVRHRFRREARPNRAAGQRPLRLEPVDGADVDRALGFVNRFDDRVELLFEKLRGRRWADRTFYTASQLGDWGLLWLLLGALAALGGAGRAERNLLRLAAVLGLDSMFVNGLLKSLIGRSRPTVDDGARPHYLRQPLTTAFPSGHASSAVVAAMLLGELGGRRWRGVLWLLGATVALSRIHVRIHHASDVAGGLLTGTVLGRLARRLWPLD
ncbi:MAG: phosphatase PAP2 family protein [bacterium]|nr:phosphatase PAP2 family protein [bacterium]MXZ30597.1 phosphatase PAP2 family protein [Acidimicrobiia bacterium]MYJ14496.1 phosphatase PAP2 family protein [Acidimicrobiia bacterium]